MQKTTRVSLLGVAIATLTLTTLPASGGEMKPYKGWIMFAPTTGEDGASYSVRHDNIGGVGHRRAVGVPPFLDPVVDPVNQTVTLTMFEEGVITYPDGSTITDWAEVVLVLGFDGLLYGGSVEAVITGGTGRFEGAYGWGKVIVEGSFVPPLDLATAEPFRMPVEGMISTVGSLKGNH